MSKCACVILNYNDAENTIDLVRRISNYKALDYIVIVDNASTDDSYAQLSSVKSDHIILISSDHNGGYGAGNNLGVKYAYETLNCQFALISNPDVFFEENAVLEMQDTLASNPLAAVVAPSQLDRNHELFKYRAWMIPTIAQCIFSVGIFTNRLCKTQSYPNEYFLPESVIVDCVPGALLMVSCPIFMKVGGYDPNIFLYAEEITLGTKLKSLGYQTILLTRTTYLHMHSISINNAIKSQRGKYKLLFKSRLYFYKNYLKPSLIEYLFARAFYSFVLFELCMFSSLKKAFSYFSSRNHIVD